MIIVNPKYTNQICHLCEKKGWRKAKIFICYNCDILIDADLNAAKNIENRGGNKVSDYSETPLVGSLDFIVSKDLAETSPELAFH